MGQSKGSLFPVFFSYASAWCNYHDSSLYLKTGNISVCKLSRFGNFWKDNSNWAFKFFFNAYCFLEDSSLFPSQCWQLRPFDTCLFCSTFGINEDTHRTSSRGLPSVPAPGPVRAPLVKSTLPLSSLEGFITFLPFQRAFLPTRRWLSTSPSRGISTYFLSPGECPHLAHPRPGHECLGTRRARLD